MNAVIIQAVTNLAVTKIIRAIEVIVAISEFKYTLAVLANRISTSISAVTTLLVDVDT